MFAYLLCELEHKEWVNLSVQIQSSWSARLEAFRMFSARDCKAFALHCTMLLGPIWSLAAMSNVSVLLSVGWNTCDSLHQIRYLNTRVSARRSMVGQLASASFG